MAERLAEARHAQPATPERWLSRNRYAVVVAGLLLLAVVYKLQFRWPAGVDLWEHAAAARELGAHPADPGHPLLPVHRPHQFFSPYLMAVGLLGRLGGVAVTTALDVAAIFNLVLLAVSLRLFVRRVTSAPHADFYALLFVLFLWGPGAWFFSGFLHFDALYIVLSYPSTFAKGLVFLALLAWVNHLDGGDARWLAAVVPLASVVLLTHPVDAVFLGIGMASFALTHPGGAHLRQILVAFAALVGAFVLALAWWPLPFYELLFGARSAHYRFSIALTDQEMYRHVLRRLGLALLVVPFFARRLWRWRVEPLAVLLAGTLLAYGYGYVSGDWSFGRLISSAQVVGAIILADERAVAGQLARVAGDVVRLRWLRGATAAVVIAGVVTLRNGFAVLPDRILAAVPPGLVHSYVYDVKISDFDFLAANHGTYTIVISDLYTSLEVPTFGSKTVAFARTQAFVDTEERWHDLVGFYDRSATTEARQRVIWKYGASLLIVPVDQLAQDPGLYEPLVGLGHVVSRNDRFLFVDLRPTE